MKLPIPGFLEPIAVSSDPNISKDSKLMRALPRVLVVDNRASDTIILCHYLQDLGCHHHVAASCKAAAARIEGLPSYDIILIDTQTLGCDEDGLLPLIRKREQESHKQRTQIIAMSATAFDDSRNAGRFSFDGYLNKPCDPQLLAQKLGIGDLDSPKW